MMGEKSAFPTFGFQDGMTLRDYFAAAALTGMLANDNGRFADEDATSAYTVADAMLAARKPKPTASAEIPQSAEGETD